MSDLFDTRNKVENAIEWRGDITVTVDGEQQNLVVRQLRDPEFWEVMSDIDTDELESLQSSLPEDDMEEFRELQQKDTLDEEEEQRLDALQTQMEEQEIDLFDELSYSTFEGIQQAAIYGVEPDQEDIRDALTRNADEIDRLYGSTGTEEARQYINDHVIKPMIEDSTDFTSFAIGVEVIGETLDNEGN